MDEDLLPEGKVIMGGKNVLQYFILGLLCLQLLLGDIFFHIAVIAVTPPSWIQGDTGVLTRQQQEEQQVKNELRDLFVPSSKQVPKRQIDEDLQHTHTEGRQSPVQRVIPVANSGGNEKVFAKPLVEELVLTPSDHLSGDVHRDEDGHKKAASGDDDNSPSLLQHHRRSQSFLDMLSPSGKPLIGTAKRPHQDKEVVSDQNSQSEKKESLLDMIGPSGRKIGTSSIGLEDTKEDEEVSDAQGDEPFSLIGLIGPSGRPIIEREESDLEDNDTERLLTGVSNSGTGIEYIPENVPAGFMFSVGEEDIVLEKDDVGMLLGRSGVAFGVSQTQRIEATKNKAVKARIPKRTRIISEKTEPISADDLSLYEVSELGQFTEQNVVTSVGFGVEETHLRFSHPIEISLPVEGVEDGEFLEVRVMHEGDEQYGAFGIANNPEVTCFTDGQVSDTSNVIEVKDQQVTFRTCGASIFIVTYTGGQNASNFIYNGTLAKTIAVTTGQVTSAIIQDINVIVDFWSIDGIDPFNPGAGSSFSSRMQFTLQSPQGTTITLLNYNVYQNAGNHPRVTVTFDDAAASLPSGVPTTGTFRPGSALSAFNGQNPLGNRTFRINHNRNDDGVILFSSSLQINALDCGDGLIQGAEACDDGNGASGDGCSSTCTIEGGYQCSGAPSSCSTIVNENQPPVITSLGGGTTGAVARSGTNLEVAPLSATDEARVTVGLFGRATLTGRTAQNIYFPEEMCDGAYVVTHRQNVNADTQRAPRILSKFGSGMQVKVDNYNSTLSAAASTPIDYMVFYEGTHTINGVRFDAGVRSIPSSAVSCNASNQAGLATQSIVNFTPAFSSSPSVIHSVSSNNDATRVVSTANGGDGTRQSEPTASRMGLHMQRSFNSCTHAAETIDYIAVQQTHTTFTGFMMDSEVSSDSIQCCSANGYQVNFTSAFSAAPQTILVSQLGEDGGNGGYAMVHSNGTINTTSFRATIDEDGPSADRNHTAEVVGAVAFSTASGTFTRANTLTYTISGGADASAFLLSGTSLEFITLPNPALPTDSNMDGIYEVNIAACDSHCDQKCDQQLIYIDINNDCGNGVIDAGETCDDNNQVSGDGCSQICQIESVFSGLVVWLKANDLDADGDFTDNPADLAAVALREDASGGNHDFSEAVSGEQPQYRKNTTDAINFNPILQFDGTDDELVDTDGENYINGITGITLFSLIQADAVGTDKAFFDTEDGDNDDDVFAFRYDAAGANGGCTDCAKVGVLTTAGAQQLETSSGFQRIQPQLLSVDRASSQPLRVFSENTQDTPSDIQANVGGSLINATEVAVGDGPKENRGGKIAEVMVYQRRLDDAERSQIASYLAVKYGITLDQTSPNSYYAGGGTLIRDAVIDSIFTNDVAGIGYDPVTFLDQRQSQSINATSELIVYHGDVTTSFPALNSDNPNAFGTGTEYLLRGHNGLTTQLSGTYAGYTNSRLNRVRRVHETGIIGTVTVRIPTSVGVLDSLFVHPTDPAFATEGIIVPLTESGGFYHATVNFTDGEYFTFGVEPCRPEDVIKAFEVQELTGSWQSFEFASYGIGPFSSLPVVLATPQTDNNINNYPIPRIRNVSLTGFEMSSCVDDGSITCGTSVSSEDFAVFVADTSQASCVSHIEAGTISVSTDGGQTAFSFSGSFSNTPYVFTTPQTSNQGSNIAAHAWVDNVTTAGGDFVGCVHQAPGGGQNEDACTSGQPSETLGWLAIDPTLFSFAEFDRGTESIPDSTWTSIAFAPSYALPPGVMVTQNSENGGQDPQYAWARDISTLGGQIRYCEADAAGICHTHNAEDVMRFSIPFNEFVAPSGDVCVFGPTSFSFSGVLQSEAYLQQVEKQFTGYFIVQDLAGADSGYYTTIEVTSFTGLISGNTLDESYLERYATGVTLLSGDANTDVQLPTGRATYREATGSFTFIKRDSGPNSYRIGEYGTQPVLRLTIPPYTRPDTYQAIITYTLFEN